MTPDLEMVPPLAPEPMDAQMAALTERVIADARADMCWRAMTDDIPERLAEVCDDAASHAHGLATWASGRLGVLRVVDGEPRHGWLTLLEDQDGPLISIGGRER